MPHTNITTFCGWKKQNASVGNGHIGMYRDIQGYVGTYMDVRGHGGDT